MEEKELTVEGDGVAGGMADDGQAVNGVERSLEMLWHGGGGQQQKALLGLGWGAALAIGEGRDANATSGGVLLPLQSAVQAMADQDLNPWQA